MYSAASLLILPSSLTPNSQLNTDRIHKEGSSPPVGPDPIDLLRYYFKAHLPAQALHRTLVVVLPFPLILNSLLIVPDGTVLTYAQLQWTLSHSRAQNNQPLLQLYAALAVIPKWQSITITLVEKVQMIAVILGSLFLVASVTWLLWSAFSPYAVWQRKDILFQICYGMYGFMDLVCIGSHSERGFRAAGQGPGAPLAQGPKAPAFRVALPARGGGAAPRIAAPRIVAMEVVLCFAEPPAHPLHQTGAAPGLIVHEGASVYRVFKRWRAVNLHWDVLNYDKATDIEESNRGASSPDVPQTPITVISSQLTSLSLIKTDTATIILHRTQFRLVTEAGTYQAQGAALSHPHSADLCSAQLKRSGPKFPLEFA
ncbi:E3 ubiquitin-protein ligase MARCH11 [Chelonia mydas]|uniref:E3 ubiquitin-protein ligase MARCH11 n=1 Tax=Chelonia mydas TaxID=8469 RepID=M7B5U4_CHEMY|nr:E3 ubiquitin-protein ligase MARCH11 [Chelonia mydas]